MPKRSHELDELEQELAKAIQVSQLLRPSLRKKPSSRDLAEYNLGVARGIMHALEALGFTDTLEEFKRNMSKPPKPTPEQSEAARVQAFFQRRMMYSRGKVK